MKVKSYIFKHLLICSIAFFLAQIPIHLCATSLKDNTPNDATVIDLNKIYVDNLSSSSDIDYFKFQLQTPGNIIVTLGHETIMASTSTYWRAYLYTENNFNSSLHYISLEGSSRSTSFQEGLPTGTYYIKISDYTYNSDNYYLKVDFEPSDNYEKSPNDSVSDATEINLNNEYIEPAHKFKTACWATKYRIK